MNAEAEDAFEVANHAFREKRRYQRLQLLRASAKTEDELRRIDHHFYQEFHNARHEKHIPVTQSTVHDALSVTTAPTAPVSATQSMNAAGITPSPSCAPRRHKKDRQVPLSELAAYIHSRHDAQYTLVEMIFFAFLLGFSIHMLLTRLSNDRENAYFSHAVSRLLVEAPIGPQGYHSVTLSGSSANDSAYDPNSPQGNVMNFYSLNSVSNWGMWLERVVLPTFFDPLQRDKAPSRGGPMGQNLLATPIRMRTFRMKRDSCSFPVAVVQAVQPPPCYGSFDEGLVETDPRSFIVTSSQNASFVRSPVQFVANECGGFNRYMMKIRGRYNSYPCGGFTQLITRDLSFNRAMQIMDDWLNIGLLSDAATRMIAVEVVLYNTALDSFVSVELLSEITGGGAWVNTANILPFDQLSGERYGSSEIAKDTFLYLMCLAFSASMFITWIRHWRRVGSVFLFLFDGWVLLNFGLQMLLASCLYLTWRQSDVSRGYSDFIKAPSTANTDHFDDLFIYLARLRQLFMLFASFAAVALILKVTEYLRFFNQLSILTRTMANVQDRILKVLVIFVLFVTAYSMAGKVLYGLSVDRYRNFQRAFSTSMLSLMGNFNYDEMYQAEPLLTWIFFWSFIVFGIFVLLNFITAIISISFDDEVWKYHPIGLRRSFIEFARMFRPRNLRKLTAVMRALWSNADYRKMVPHFLFPPLVYWAHIWRDVQEETKNCALHRMTVQSDQRQYLLRFLAQHKDDDAVSEDLTCNLPASALVGLANSTIDDPVAQESATKDVLIDRDDFIRMIRVTDSDETVLNDNFLSLIFFEAATDIFRQRPPEGILGHWSFLATEADLVTKSVDDFFSTIDQRTKEFATDVTTILDGANTAGADRELVHYDAYTTSVNELLSVGDVAATARFIKSPDVMHIPLGASAAVLHNLALSFSSNALEVAEQLTVRMPEQNKDRVAVWAALGRLRPSTFAAATSTVGATMTLRIVNAVMDPVTSMLPSQFAEEFLNARDEAGYIGKLRFLTRMDRCPTDVAKAIQLWEKLPAAVAPLVSFLSSENVTDEEFIEYVQTILFDDDLSGISFADTVCKVVTPTRDALEVLKVLGKFPQCERNKMMRTRDVSFAANVIRGLCPLAGDIQRAEELVETVIKVVNARSYPLSEIVEKLRPNVERLLKKLSKGETALKDHGSSSIPKDTSLLKEVAAILDSPTPQQRNASRETQLAMIAENGTEWKRKLFIVERVIDHQRIRLEDEAPPSLLTVAVESMLTVENTVLTTNERKEFAAMLLQSTQQVNHHHLRCVIERLFLTCIPKLWAVGIRTLILKRPLGDDNNDVESYGCLDEVWAFLATASEATCVAFLTKSSHSDDKTPTHSRSMFDIINSVLRVQEEERIVAWLQHSFTTIDSLTLRTCCSFMACLDQILAVGANNNSSRPIAVDALDVLVSTDDINKDSLLKLLNVECAKTLHAILSNVASLPRPTVSTDVDTAIDSGFQLSMPTKDELVPSVSAGRTLCAVSTRIALLRSCAKALFGK